MRQNLTRRLLRRANLELLLRPNAYERAQCELAHCFGVSRDAQKMQHAGGRTHLRPSPGVMSTVGRQASGKRIWLTAKYEPQAEIALVRVSWG